jgi:hypothetical protein
MQRVFFGSEHTVYSIGRGRRIDEMGKEGRPGFRRHILFTVPVLSAVVAHYISGEGGGI